MLRSNGRARSSRNCENCNHGKRFPASRASKLRNPTTSMHPLPFSIFYKKVFKVFVRKVVSMYRNSMEILRSVNMYYYAWRLTINRCNCRCNCYKHKTTKCVVLQACRGRANRAIDNTMQISFASDKNHAAGQYTFMWYVLILLNFIWMWLVCVLLEMKDKMALKNLFCWPSCLRNFSWGECPLFLAMLLILASKATKSWVFKFYYINYFELALCPCNNRKV